MEKERRRRRESPPREARVRIKQERASPARRPRPPRSRSPSPRTRHRSRSLSPRPRPRSASPSPPRRRSSRSPVRPRDRSPTKRERSPPKRERSPPKKERSPPRRGSRSPRNQRGGSPHRGGDARIKREREPHRGGAAEPPRGGAAEPPRGGGAEPHRAGAVGAEDQRVRSDPPPERRSRWETDRPPRERGGRWDAPRGGPAPQEQQEERQQHDERRREARARREEEEGAGAFGVPQEGGEGGDDPPPDKEKPDFGLSGALTEDTNTFRGVVIKYNEPPEARIPKRRWRLYPFKNDEPLPVMYVHRQSAYLLGRDRKIADISIDHPSCSKQHAIFQYRLVEYTRLDGTPGRRVKPYLLDLGSGNGTYLNNQRIEGQRYYELKEKDVLKFGFSSREYVLLHEFSDTAEVDAQTAGEEDEDDGLDE
ncbi:smad nuclear-interacting protein 1 [Gadus chalcogrammus]|uniref:smad nuclear-interacting protein 1 n=1 Tax=Gadus chalcogrammus TaxID=1042646 RepID=UPI0024C3B321|nr:smad nuclear-interacting protein 1 [Gadus chalcogrammus]